MAATEWHSVSMANEDETSTSGRSHPASLFTPTQTFVPPLQMPSPGTTITTTAVNRRDLSTHCPDVPNMVPQIGSSGFVDPPAKWGQAPNEVPFGESLINCSMDESDAISQTSHALNISPAVLGRLIDAYFSNMTAFSLFHRPTFTQKLRSMGPSLYLHALLASMCSFSARFLNEASDHMPGNPFDEMPSEIPCADHFHQVALRFEEESLTQCSDNTPPLEFLQAIILTTFFQLTKGVHGRAWRWLGTCIRVAHELDLHRLDADKQHDHVPSTADDILAWSEEEERRRCWWAVWEMDTFASTVRGVPTGLNWSQSKVFLPVEDRLWFQQKFHASCFLAAKPADRWKLLQRSGNESPVAWNLVVISLTRDAQTTSYLGRALGTTTYCEPEQQQPRPAPTQGQDSKRTHNNTVEDQLSIISHALQCTLLALPDALQYHGEPLAFTSVEPNQLPVSSMLHQAKYSIYVLTELTRFMIAHYYTFCTGIVKPHLSSRRGSDRDISEANRHPGTLLMCVTQKPNANGLQQYVEASDRIVLLLNRCSSTHVRYVNPFLATSIWLAATVQLLNKKFGPSGGNRELAEARYNVLRLTYKQFIKFWGSPIGLLQTLDSLEDRFDHLLRSGEGGGGGGGGGGHSDAAKSAQRPLPFSQSAQGLDQVRSRRSDTTTTVSLSGSQSRPSNSYTSALTEPNLTGSGVNPTMMGSSSVHSSRVVDEPYQDDMDNFASSVTGAGLQPQQQQPIQPHGAESAVKEGVGGGRMDDSSAVDFGPMTSTGHDPTLDDGMRLPMNFDYDCDNELSLYLNNLLSGSYSGSLGPL
ncbi:hypothetical protein AYO20_09859 [Fonsecaea nubica]|uniref:Xylanolytic transcriptional activator regulatory domain-containing protein n=1 Tax=Fonsecaea nubica TaxID=856822 RepID=A0A178CEB9_9EURO|nr:hypothetical protein AYO20_09859 [Fonsecaea nubica]OAL27051.1 hypothetical protein AYO20_09859 [Fonsecaea nubica]